MIWVLVIESQLEQVKRTEAVSDGKIIKDSSYSVKKTSPLLVRTKRETIEEDMVWVRLSH